MRISDWSSDVCSSDRIGVLAQHGLRIAPYDDTLVMSFALDAGKHQHGLDELAKLHLDHVCLTFKDMCGTGKSPISFAEVPLDRAIGQASWRARACQYVEISVGAVS